MPKPKEPTKIKTTTRTIKLQMFPLGETKEDRSVEWKRLKKLLYDARRAANRVVSSAYLGNELMVMMYKWARAKTKEEKLKIRDKFYSKSGIFGKQLDSLCEAVIQDEFPELPSCITNPLKREVSASVAKERLDVMKGTRVMRTYKQGMSVPVHKTSVKFAEDDKGHRIIWRLGRKGKQFEFGIVYGQDRGGFRKVVQDIIDGEKEWGAPKIQLRKRDGKLFLNVPVKTVQGPQVLNQSLAVGVDLGVNVLVYAGLSKGPARRWFYAGTDILVFRRQFRERRRRAGRASKASGTRGGHGRKRRNKASDKILDKERRGIKHINHTASAGVIEFALQHGAGTIKMEDLSGIKSNIESTFLNQNWCYYELQTMIEQKAKAVGIQVLYIDPAYTSQTCIHCQNCEKGQRKGIHFKCAACGEKEHADYGASVNIARKADGKEKRAGKGYNEVKEPDLVEKRSEASK